MHQIIEFIFNTKVKLSKFNLKRSHMTHIGTFALGVFLTFGVVIADGKLNTSEYRKSGAASVLKPFSELQTLISDNETTESTSTVTTSSEIAEVDDEKTIDEELLIVEGFEPAPLASEQVVKQVSPPVAKIEINITPPKPSASEVLANAKALLENLSSGGSNDESEIEVVFVTPNGVKIGADGNVINENSVASEAATTNDDENVVILPEGVYSLPSGQLVYGDGRIYKGDTDPNTNYVQQNPINDYYTSPTGATFNRQGQLISLAPKKKEELITPTTVSVDNPPEHGTTINIPLEVKSWSYNNHLLECKINFYNNNRELCNLYRTNPDDYDWVAVKTEYD